MRWAEAVVSVPRIEQENYENHSFRRNRTGRRGRRPGPALLARSVGNRGGSAAHLHHMPRRQTWGQVRRRTPVFAFDTTKD